MKHHSHSQKSMNKLGIIRFIYLMMSVLFVYPSLSNGQDELCFPKHEGLPHTGGIAPTIDGYIEPDLGVTTSELETGWVRSGRLTYVGDTGLPQMVFQSLRHKSQDYLYLSFLVRHDQFYDDMDTIVLVFRPDYSVGGTTQTGQERRIDIHPVREDFGAGDTGDSYDNATYQMRTNKDPFDTNYYKWNISTSAWDAMSAPTNTDIKVRSWKPITDDPSWSVEIKLPLNQSLGGADWINFATEFGLYFDVIRMCGEVLCASEYFPFEEYATFQFAWPRADYATGDRLLKDPDTGAIGLSEHEIPPSWLGKGKLASAVDCRGVKFVGGREAIGVSNPSDPTGPLSNEISGPDMNEFIARIENDGAASAEDITAEFRIANWGIGSSDPGTWDPIPEYTDTDHGTDNSNPAGPVTLVPSASGEMSMKWKLQPDEIVDYNDGTFNDHQCIWVRLDSDKDVYFSESSMRRNMNFVELSSFEENADISAQGYPPPSEGGTFQDFVLRVNQRILVSNKEYPGWTNRSNYAEMRSARETTAMGRADHYTSWLLREIFDGWLNTDQVVSSWVWVMNGYRKTGYTLTLNEQTHRIYESVGAFGYVGQHEGEVDEWKDSVQGDLEEVGDDTGVYQMQVKDGEVSSIKTVLEAKERGICIGPFCCKGLSNIASTGLGASVVMIGFITSRRRKRGKKRWEKSLLETRLNERKGRPRI